jgi:periplasmic protein TonB
VSRRRDVITAAIAVVLHAGLAVAIVRDSGAPRVRSRPIEVEFRPPKPPPAKPVVAEEPAPARKEPARPVRAAPRKLAAVTEPPAPAPTPSEPPPEAEPPPRPAPPVYGIAMESPTATASPVSAPVGGSTVADPGRAGRPGPPGAPGGTPDGRDSAPVSALNVKVMPEIDTDACGRTITYPPAAERNGIEGEVRLRVTLDERGRVSSVRVISGLGYGLDQAAVEALKHRCKFTPAIADDGRPVPFVVESYTFNFELPR